MGVKASFCLPLGLPAVPLSVPGPSPAEKVLEARVGGGVWPEQALDCLCGLVTHHTRTQETCLHQGCSTTTKRRPYPYVHCQGN